MSYYDFMLAAVPTVNKDEYIEFCKRMAAVFVRHGAVATGDLWGDNIPEGKVTSLPMAVKCEEGETVVAGWIEWPDKAARDAGWENAMADPEMSGEMPHDGKRMIFGGFEQIV